MLFKKKSDDDDDDDDDNAPMIPSPSTVAKAGLVDAGSGPLQYLYASIVEYCGSHAPCNVSNLPANRKAPISFCFRLLLDHVSQFGFAVLRYLPLKVRATDSFCRCIAIYAVTLHSCFDRSLSSPELIHGFSTLSPSEYC